ncbi:MAG: ACT domain-containing protein [Desulfovibrio sp.]|nr:ACT domain-containing protein [Desulfovibrio sp.]
MKVEQLSVFLENKAGRLAGVTTILYEAGVNIMALSLADTSEFGILRLIVDNHEKAQAALKAEGLTVSRTGVVAIEVAHSPGGLNRILHILEKHGINIEYMYGFPYQGEAAIIIFRFDRSELAIDLLQQNGVRIFSESDICRAGKGVDEKPSHI